MKKELITLTALMLASSFAAGCGSGTADKETDAPDTDKTTPEAESVTPPRTTSTRPLITADSSSHS